MRIKFHNMKHITLAFAAFAITLTTFTGLTQVAYAYTCGNYVVQGGAGSVGRGCSSTSPYNQFRVKTQCYVDNFPYAPTIYTRYGSWVNAGGFSTASCYVAGFKTGLWGSPSTEFRY